MRREPEGSPPNSLSRGPRLSGATLERGAVATPVPEDKGLLALWRERMIDLRQLAWPLRLALITSILAALASAALIIARDIPQAQLLINLSDNQPSAQIPTVAFVVALTLWLVAWSAVLTGALHGHWALRLFVFAAFLYITIETVTHQALALIYLAPLIVIALWMGAVSILQWRWRRMARSLPRQLPAVSFIVVLICFAAHYALIWWMADQVHDATAILTQLVTQEFEAFAFVLLPVLFLAGSDFAEWAEAVATQGNTLLQRFRSAWPLVGVTILVALAILTSVLIRRGTFSPFDLPSALDLVSLGVYGGIGILLLLGIARLGRVRSWPRLAVPPGALVAATVIIMAFLTGPLYLTNFILSLNSPSAAASVKYTVLRHAETATAPTFSLAYPSDWRYTVHEPASAQDLLGVAFDGQDMSGDPRLILVEFPGDGESGIAPDQLAQQVVTGFCAQTETCTATVEAAPNQGPWTVERTAVHDQDSTGQLIERDGTVWIRTTDTAVWVLYGAALPAGAHAATPIFTAMVDSWRPDLTAVVPAIPLPPLVSFFQEHSLSNPLGYGLLPLVLGLLIGVPLLVRGRRRPGLLAMTGLFLVIFGLTDSLLFLPQIIAQFGVPTDRIVLFSLDAHHSMRLSTIPTLSLPVLQALTAFFTLVIVGWLLVRRRIRDGQHGRAMRVIAALLMLNIGLLIISWLDVALSASDQLAQRFTVAQGVLLVLAFLWDLLTSGAQVTNVEARRTPRVARVLLYMGYSTLAFSQVLYFTALRGSSSYDFSGQWTNIGLTTLGIPLLLTIVLLRLARAGSDRNAESAAEGHQLPVV